jgi:hypothetical protein
LFPSLSEWLTIGDKIMIAQKGGWQVSRKKIVCPECGHRHRIEYGATVKTIGVRSRKITGNQFEYSLTMPEHVNTDNPIHLSTLQSDVVLAMLVGVAGGGAGGFLARMVAPDYALEAIGLGACIGLGLACGWLIDETNQRLKRIPPWFLEQRAALQAGAAQVEPGAAHLTMDHRYRDGHTEAGRTVQRFGVLPVDVDRFGQWAAAVLGPETNWDKANVATSLAIANWTGSGKLFSRKEYEALLALLKQSGAVTPLPGKGNVLTGGGRRALRQHLKDHPPAPLGSVHSG